MVIDFRERGREGEREENTDVKEKTFVFVDTMRIKLNL